MIPMVPLNKKQSYSMEFHGPDTSSSMELGLHQFRLCEQIHGIPWNSMELGVRQFRWHEQFHGIPWNLECANFDDTSSSMEFYGTWRVPISMTRAVPWNSMELGVRQIWWHELFHGIPRNLRCADFDDTINSMEFHGTCSAPISIARTVPWNSWNSMELEVRHDNPIGWRKFDCYARINTLR